jgi:hypothetical protein
MFNNKTDLLDPLSVIVKLFIYSYKTVGTKISIKNNKLSIQEPGFFQSTVRTYMGDTKNDLNIIFNPIIFACDLYLKNKTKEKYKMFFHGCIIAFDKLKETYVTSDIIYTIFKGVKTNVELFLNNEDYDIQNVISDINKPSYVIKKQIYYNINKIWTEERITILFGYLYEIINYKIDAELIYLLNALSVFMDYIDVLTINMINLLQ